MVEWFASEYRLYGIDPPMVATRKRWRPVSTRPLSSRIVYARPCGAFTVIVLVPDATPATGAPNVIAAAETVTVGDPRARLRFIWAVLWPATAAVAQARLAAAASEAIQLVLMAALLSRS